MSHLSTTSRATIETAARRAIRDLAGSPLPVTVGIDVQVSGRGAIVSIQVDDVGQAYELDDLERTTIEGAILDALDHATSGPRTWRRIA